MTMNIALILLILKSAHGGLLWKKMDKYKQPYPTSCWIDVRGTITGRNECQTKNS